MVILPSFHECTHFCFHSLMKCGWSFFSNWYNWRVRWKKGVRYFTQNRTLPKMLQISHAVLFRCVKQCSVCFFTEVFFVYEMLRMQKSLYLWSHQHVTRKTVISLIIQQNIDLLQRVTIKSVDFRVKPLQFWFRVNVRPQSTSPMVSFGLPRHFCITVLLYFIVICILW